MISLKQPLMKSNFRSLHSDAFSSGQISSKLWLCDELERTSWTSEETAIYGGWYGVTAFLLLSRGQFQVNKIRSFDMDPHCETIADMINENWVWQDWRFKAFTADCNHLDTGADLVINTSTEHFENMRWWDNLPYGTRVVLQGNNMPHEDHVTVTSTLEEFCMQFPVTERLYAGELPFVYPTWKFTRYMLIGIK
jgi:hypothetical protein